ncbi:hypothetical protein Poly24_27150 [Rosistilla carotiformis]|uniref:Uncharacterized protein n=1 Tax=Rosistilla carotiformis TaxID=2528017 RepID=A0A518JTW9_9BACT|nr:hypothetical protein [Rosistilla carotiformis]QDV69001.1 hypothetical protein Poly24_27150 [Rosistilla carotiformis]
MPIRKRILKPDSQGRYRPYLGYRIDGKQPRFNLGTDKAQAHRRMNRLFELWDENVAVNGEDVWSPLALDFAQDVAKGKRQIEYPFQSHFLEADDPAAEYAQMLEVERQRFPSLDLVPTNLQIYATGCESNEQLVADEVRQLQDRLKELGALPPIVKLPQKLIAGTLHEALDRYAEDDVKSRNIWPESKRLKQSGHRRLEMIDRFKERHDDLPLSLLGRDACKDMLRFWCQRPPVKNRKSGKFDGPPIAVSTARHHRKELDRFFKWLDSSDEFAWKLPRGFTTLDRAISPTEEEFAQRLSVVQKDVYSVQELAELNRNATVLERLFLFIGLNCGMGAAELGRLKSQDILLFHKHEFQDRLGFESTSRDSFIRYLRPKTSVFGEWLLWPETVQLVQWGLERSRQIGSELIFVSEKGTPWYNVQHNKNPQAKFTNTFNRLIKRVQKSDPEFRRLAFGTLRDTLPNILRIRHSSEMASLCLAHGSTYRGDKLIDCYTNKPFGRFHDLMRSARNHLEPVFQASPEDPTAAPIQQYIPLNVRRKIQEMLDSKTPASKIATECGVSAATVYREKERISQ